MSQDFDHFDSSRSANESDSAPRLESDTPTSHLEVIDGGDRDLRGVDAILLPGELRVETHLVRDAVVHLNQIYARSTLQVALEVGSYVLDKFFDGDPAAFRKRGTGHRTFTALSQRDELQFNRVWLWRAVSVVDQLRQLPAHAAKQLPFTHHTALLSVRDDAKKVALAERAAAQGWSKRRLQDEVALATQDQAHRGRPRMSPMRRQLNQAVRIAQRLETTEVVGGESRADLLASIETIRGCLARVEESLIARLPTDVQQQPINAAE